MYTSYLNLFQTHTDYEIYLSANNTIPNVIYCTDENHMHYLRNDNNPNKPSILTKNYLTTVARENGTISFNICKDMGTEYITSISYSTDNGETWITTNNTNNKTENLVIDVNVNEGDKVLWKGNAIQMSDDGYDYVSNFSSTCEFDVRGNIMSLLYDDNFDNQTTIETIGCFYNLFGDFTEKSPKIVNASMLILPATTLAENCYYGMFEGCTSLINAPKLPATTLAKNCYSGMFRRCTSLVTAPELHATTLAELCCYEMFKGCTSLINAPKLPATTLAVSCYRGMFRGCTSLTIAPELPAIALADSCYYSMFQSCTSLTTAPKLPATSLPGMCYADMFNSCVNLNLITCLATNISGTRCTNNWVNNVSVTGTFIKHPSMEDWDIGNNGIPEGWTSTDAVSENYLTFNILSDGIINWRTSNASTTVKTISYSINDGEWTDITSSVSGISFNVSTGDKVRFKGNNRGYASSTNDYNTFAGSTASFDLEGNIMSLVDEVMFDYNTTLIFAYSYTFTYLFKTTNIIRANNLILPSIRLVSYCYYGMFNNCKNLIITPKLPATTLAYRCYSSMFLNCTNLINTPELPATILADYCYDNMFGYCTSLTTAPELPATQLTVDCYYAMFQYCTNLTMAPELPATILANDCYSFMFYGCTRLTKAPELPATTLAVYCYSHMFHACTSIKKTPKLPATTLAHGCYSNMFYNCSSLTIPPELPATTMEDWCYNNMFNSCTSLITVPLLPATQLADYCYSEMFQNCTSLTIAPELPATVLASNCYAGMFKGCTNLTTPPELQVTVLASSCYASMFWNCTSLITAPELPATTLVYNCYGHMFYNCTSLNYIKCMIETPNYNHTEEWVYNVAENGTFIGSPISSWLTGVNGIPEGWTTNVNIIESYESNGTIRIWLDDFGNGEEMIIEDYGSINDYFEEYIDSPYEFGGKPYEYTGEMIEWNGNDYYIWVFNEDAVEDNGLSDNCKYILTDTIDFQELDEMSVSYNYNNRICPYVAMLFDDLSTYEEGQDTNRFLVLVEDIS